MNIINKNELSDRMTHNVMAFLKIFNKGVLTFNEYLIKIKNLNPFTEEKYTIHFPGATLI
jgi:hypothetical protein